MTLVRSPGARRDRFEFSRLLSGNSPTDREMANAHHLDALVVRELPTDGGFGDESLTAHGAHDWQRKLFRYLQDMDGIVATAFPQIGSEGQRTDKNKSGQHFRNPQ
jgi:hypothetical protein